MGYRFNFRDIWAQTDFIIEGVLITLVLSAVTMVAGLIIGTAGAAARVYGPRWLKAAVATYVEVIRNTPLLVQLFLVFFGLPSAGIRLDAMTAALIALAINLGAYATEIIRAGLEAIPKAQIEAGHSLGLSGPQVFRYVVLFPAMKIIYPALTSQFVLVMLATSV
ncbi:MAG: amino acid ABC transporter permease, partial [Alphaproteobacteria bacterium]|nr:amino acid ABC transporter permease [Alphaproteobacteria bacterium]